MGERWEAAQSATGRSELWDGEGLESHSGKPEQQTRLVKRHEGNGTERCAATCAGKTLKVKP